MSTFEFFCPKQHLVRLLALLSGSMSQIERSKNGFDDITLQAQVNIFVANNLSYIGDIGDKCEV